ncbi:peptidoglycan-binding protein [Nitrosomonas sp. Nm166]|uniref:peptidoglycan-binding protein n=1 Tax=Nitrosomonas sp. Nm166 TaxID=1881054 RepID=UPI0008E8885E|nr:peptidoglycan-binding protein [Nitrosomonas sp. Nm166]SFD98638.1 Putative peptidoglycan binding domain-containing protein [Nitrosomonas sp. Nm166]
MNQELSFEMIPFKIAPESQGEMFEEESEWGRRGSYGGGRRHGGPHSRAGLHPKGIKRPPVARPRPAPRGRRRPWGVIREPYGIVSEPYFAEPVPVGSERVRWLQDCLNQAMGTQLPVTGTIGPETRSAVRSFQRQQGLRTTGIAGPDTEEALRSACERRDGQPSAEEMEFGTGYEGEWLEMELPTDFLDNYNRLLSSMSPADRSLWATRRCYRLSQWDRAPAQGGVYLVIFRKPMRAGRIGYVGESGNLRDRMQGYRRDAIFLGLDPDNYAFCYVRTPERGIIEGRLRDILNPTGLVTNQLELEIALESPFSEAEEIELAAELLSISSEEELDQFLGKMFKGIGRGLKKAGRFIGRRVLPVLGKGLKTLAKAALPVAGKVLGSFIPIPGVGTAIGGAVGTALSKALELEFSGLNTEEAELERARRFVRIAGTAMRQAALSSPDIDAEIVVNEAIMSAARKHLPYLHLSESERIGMPGAMQQGRWMRRGDKIVVLGAPASSMMNPATSQGFSSELKDVGPLGEFEPGSPFREFETESSAGEFETRGDQKNWYYFDAWLRPTKGNVRRLKEQGPSLMTAAAAKIFCQGMCEEFASQSNWLRGTVVTRCWVWLPKSEKWRPCKNVSMNATGSFSCGLRCSDETPELK